MESGKTRFEPLTDPVFSYLFSEEDTILSMQEIINGVLIKSGDSPIREISRMDSQYAIIGEKIGARGGRLDIRAEAEDGTLFDIEVQLRRQLFMNDRSWFYGSRMLSEAFREGQDYLKMPRVRIINLLDFVLRENHPDYLQPIGITYRKEPADVATDAFRIYNIELPKFRKEYQTMDSALHDPLARWLYLLDRGYRNDKEMEVLTRMTDGMKAFARKYNRSLDDPKLEALYELDLSAKRDQRAIAYTERVLGRAEGRADIVRGMLNNGIPVDLIYKCVNAPRAEVDALIARIRSGLSD